MPAFTDREIAYLRRGAFSHRAAGRDQLGHQRYDAGNSKNGAAEDRALVPLPPIPAAKRCHAGLLKGWFSVAVVGS